MTIITALGLNILQTNVPNMIRFAHNVSLTPEICSYFTKLNGEPHPLFTMGSLRGRDIKMMLNADPILFTKKDHPKSGSVILPWMDSIRTTERVLNYLVRKVNRTMLYTNKDVVVIPIAVIDRHAYLIVPTTSKL